MKTKMILAIFFQSVICLSLVGWAMCDGTVISISPPATTLPSSAIGTSFQIDINIAAVTNLWSWKVRLNWNPTILEFSKIAEGPFLKSAGSTLFPPPLQGNGSLTEISDTLLSTIGVNGSGILATVTFKVLVAGQSGMTLNETELFQPPEGLPPSNPQIAHTVSNGQLIVLPPPPLPVGGLSFPASTFTPNLLSLYLAFIIMLIAELLLVKPKRQKT
jgi:hypothetical protein